jgi:CBS domain-containing protein
MARLARDIMTPDPACCGPNTTLDEVAKLMVQNDCGEIPVIDVNDHAIGVVTDGDIVCRIVAHRMSPIGHTAESCMTRNVVCVHEDESLDRIVSTMERHQIRRVPVVRNGGPASSRRPIWRGMHPSTTLPSWSPRCPERPARPRSSDLED